MPVECLDFQTPVLISSQPEVCYPWSNPIQFPMYLFVILVIIVIILTLNAISRCPVTDRNGHNITSSQKWAVGIISVLIILLVACLFGWWMYYLSQRCESSNAWLVFVLALFFPVLLFIVSSLIIAALLGLNQAFWLWSRSFTLEDNCCDEKRDE